MDLPSRLDLFALGRSYLLQRATRIDPAQVDIVGSDVNIFVGSTSHVAYAIVLQLAYAISRLLLDSAEGEDLDRYAWDRYQLVRKGASPALGAVTVSRPTFAAGAGSIAVGSKIVALGGSEYVTTGTISFGSTTLSQTVAVRAANAGKADQVGANTLRKFGPTVNPWDPTLVLNNASATSGGEDVEDDDTFRERIRGFWTTARRGTLGAIEYGAIQVPGVVSANAVEALTVFGDQAVPARVIDLYIADSSGVASDALASQVRTQLFDYRAGGIAVIVHTSLPQIVNVVLNLTFEAGGVDQDTLTEAVRTAVMQAVNNLGVNETLTRSTIQAVLESFKPDGLIVNESSLVLPVGDTVPALGQTIRTTLANVTIGA